MNKQHTKPNIVIKSKDVTRKDNVTALKANKTVDDWPYYDGDVSDALQYDYRNVWWTVTKQPSKPTTLSTKKLYYKDMRLGNGVFPQSNPNKTSPIPTKSNKQISKHNEIKNVTVAKKIKPKNADVFYKNKIETTFNSNVKRNRETTGTTGTHTTVARIRKHNKMGTVNKTTKRIPRSFMIFQKDDNGDMGVMANKTNLFIDRKNNITSDRVSFLYDVKLNEDISFSEFDGIIISKSNFADAPRQGNGQSREMMIKIQRDEDVNESIKKLPPGANIMVGDDQVGTTKVDNGGLLRIQVPVEHNQTSFSTKRIQHNPYIPVPNLPQRIGNMYEGNRPNFKRISNTYFRSFKPTYTPVDFKKFERDLNKNTFNILNPTFIAKSADQAASLGNNPILTATKPYSNGIERYPYNIEPAARQRDNSKHQDIGNQIIDQARNKNYSLFGQEPPPFVTIQEEEVDVHRPQTQGIP